MRSAASGGAQSSREPAFADRLPWRSPPARIRTRPALIEMSTVLTLASLASILRSPALRSAFSVASVAPASATVPVLALAVIAMSLVRSVGSSTCHDWRRLLNVSGESIRSESTVPSMRGGSPR